MTYGDEKIVLDEHEKSFLNGVLRDHRRYPPPRGAKRPFIRIPRGLKFGTYELKRQFTIDYYNTFRKQEEFDDAEMQNKTGYHYGYHSTTLKRIYDCFAAEWQAKEASPTPCTEEQFRRLLGNIDDHYMYIQSPLFCMN